ncbi:MAG: hypothetical protein IJV40_12055 [Oscillospiraceae bacterium]|nr:hypothetical protein [Oscillospiraceae bacterium]
MSELSCRYREARRNGGYEDALTDREVQKLNRRDLLTFLLEAQSENETLRRDRAALRKQVKELEEELARAREQSSADSDVQTAAILQEARIAADDAAASQREAQAARDQRLQEWELRLQQREDLMNRQEEGLKKLIAATDGEASRCLQDAEQHAANLRRSAEADAEAVKNSAADQAAETIRLAEQTARETVRKAEETAADTVRQAEEAAAIVLKNAEAAASATEQKAAADAELLLQHAQDDSNAFWQDVSELLQKRLRSLEGGSDGE